MRKQTKSRLQKKNKLTKRRVMKGGSGTNTSASNYIKAQSQLNLY